MTTFKLEDLETLMREAQRIEANNRALFLASSLEKLSDGKDLYPSEILVILQAHGTAPFKDRLAKEGPPDAATG